MSTKIEKAVATKTTTKTANKTAETVNTEKKVKVYFKDCKTLEDVRSQFLDYAVKTKSPEKSKEFMKQYISVAKSVQNKHYVYGTDKIFEQNAVNSPELFAKMIFALKKLEGVTLKLDGRLLWASGNTKDNRETLKKFGFSYRPKKTQWVWNDVETRNWRASVIPA